MASAHNNFTSSTPPSTTDLCIQMASTSSCDIGLTNPATGHSTSSLAADTNCVESSSPDNHGIVCTAGDHQMSSTAYTDIGGPGGMPSTSSAVVPADDSVTTSDVDWLDKPASFRLGIVF